VIWGKRFGLSSRVEVVQRDHVMLLNWCSSQVFESNGADELPDQVEKQEGTRIIPLEATRTCGDA
jgi:hypothetical protein